MEKKLYICTFVFLKEILFYETRRGGMMDSTPERSKNAFRTEFLCKKFQVSKYDKKYR